MERQEPQAQGHCFRASTELAELFPRLFKTRSEGQGLERGISVLIDMLENLILKKAKV